MPHRFRFCVAALCCVVPLVLDSSESEGGAVSEIEVARCSFVLNWAASADLSTPSAAALELGTKAQVAKVTIRDSLFYANFGGAIQLPPKDAPELVLRRNNFVGNGLLQKDSTSGAAALLTFESGQLQAVAVEKLGNAEFVKEAEGNVSISPGLSLSLVGAKDSPSEKETWDQALERLLGQPGAEGAAPGVKVYAPKLVYDPKSPPVPSVSAAHSYGASPRHVE